MSNEITWEMRRDARNLNGVYAGMLEPTEYEPLIKAGLLQFSYEGPAGFFVGLAKLRATRLAYAS